MHARTLLAGLALATTLLSSPGCERLFASDVGAGVARLTVRNAAAITQLINADTRCGFASEAVLASYTQQGAVGAEGIVTWTVEGCAIDLGERTVLSVDCNGVEMSGRGRVVVSATRTVGGILTGNPETPVIPGGPDAVKIDVTASFETFHVARTDNPNALTNKRGTLRFRAAPRLAEGVENPGVCAVATPNVALSDVTYDGAVVHLVTPEREFDVEVQGSAYEAQIGVRADKENHIGGRITVWGQTIDLDDDPTLDDSYVREDFVKGYTDAACLEASEPSERLALPLDFECEGVAEILAGGAARLSVRSLGTIASLLEADTNCGFQRDGALAEVTGAPGEEGSAVWRAEACTLRFPEDTVVDVTCDGTATLVSGTVTVTATKTLRGLVSGSAQSPIIPLDDAPAVVDIGEARFDHFRVATSSAPEALTHLSGSMSGKVSPRTAVGASTGACSVPTRTARVSEISYRPSDVEVRSPSGIFRARIEGASLEAVNGSWEDDENLLRGHIRVDGTDYDVAELPGGNALDPSFDPATFAEGDACAPDLALPRSHQCDFFAYLGGGVARLTVNAFGQIASALEADTRCGFQSPGVMENVALTGDLGERGAEGVYTVDGCTLEYPVRVAVAEDCAGATTYLEGRVTVSGTKTLRGIASGDPNEPIVPTTWEPATLSLTMTFDDLTVSSSKLTQALTARSGTLSGTLRPRTAMDIATGACSLPTPVATFDDLVWQGGELTLRSGDNTVDLPVSSSDLRAVNGLAGDAAAPEENLLSGTITVGGRQFSLPVDPSEPGLDPSYQRDAFYDAFSCSPNLRVPERVEECSFNKTLGEGAARLLIQSVGEVASMANADNDCGFSTLGVLTNPIEVVGEPGEMGSMSFRIEECALAIDPDDASTPAKEDCLGKETYRGGGFTVTGGRFVTGLREEINVLFITADSIVPASRDAVTLTLESVTFQDFVLSSRNPDGSSGDLGVLTLHTGTLTGTVRPVLGENAQSGAFDVPTPVSALDDIWLVNAEATLQAQGKTFRLTIEEASLDAFNGTYEGRSNEISGSIRVNGETLQLPLQPLNPAFDQADFDARYQCTADLAGLVPSD